MLKALRVQDTVKDGTPYFQLWLDDKCVSQSKKRSTLRDYIIRHYFKNISPEDKTYYSKLVLLQLENGRSLEEINRLGTINTPVDSIHNTPVDSIHNTPVDSIYKEIIESSQEVYSKMGWGWGESVYREALTKELEYMGYKCSQEVSMPVYYKDNELSHVNCRIDIYARKDGNEFVLELKSDNGTPNSVERAVCQCERYLRNYKCIDNGIERHGMVINFPDKMTDGVILFKIING